MSEQPSRPAYEMLREGMNRHTHRLRKVGPLLILDYNDGYLGLIRGLGIGAINGTSVYMSRMVDFSEQVSI